jgi:hypothetical protein
MCLKDAHHYRPGQYSGGPSWLTFLGHMKDSLWSMDLFGCESATLRTHWVLVVMDQYSRRIIGFGVHAGTVDGGALCRMFNRAIRGQSRVQRYLSPDNDPLYRLHRITGHPDRTELWKSGRRFAQNIIANPVSSQWRALVRLPGITSVITTLGSATHQVKSTHFHPCGFVWHS